MIAKSTIRLLVLSAVLLACLALAISFGASELSPREVAETLLGRGDPSSRAIVLHLRLPRVVLAALVGGALALSGAVFQALLRNPLAEPYILGVSGGAAVGAVLVVVLGWSVRFAWTVPIAAFVGALVAIGLVLRIALSVGRSLSSRVFILAGVVVGAFFNAAILLLLNFADAQSFRSAVFWMMGNLSGVGWSDVVLLTVYLVPAATLLLILARPLNLLAMGEETASYLGVRVERVKLLSYLVTSLLVAAAVAASGIIGFVGLIVPHAVRIVWGSDHRFLLPASLLSGASFLLLTDTVARTVVAPAELPTGVITALIGVPVFIALLVRSEA